MSIVEEDGRYEPRPREISGGGSLTFLGCWDAGGGSGPTMSSKGSDDEGGVGVGVGEDERFLESRSAECDWPALWSSLAGGEAFLEGEDRSEAFRGWVLERSLPLSRLCRRLRWRSGLDELGVEFRLRRCRLSSSGLDDRSLVWRSV